MFILSQNGNSFTITQTEGNEVIVSTTNPLRVVGNVDRILLYEGENEIIKMLTADIETIDDVAPGAELADVMEQVIAIVPMSNFSAASQLNAPSDLLATPGSTVADLSWANDTNATTAEVQVSASNDYSSPTTYTISAPTATKHLTGLTNGTPLYWRVRNKAAGYLRSAWTNGLTFTPHA